MTIESSRRAEWRAYWPLPFIGMIATTASAAYSYGGGVLIEPVTKEFGWDRATFSSAFTLQMLFGLIVMPLLGRMLDTIGPRKAALAGIVPFMVIFSLFYTATGSVWNWWMLSLLLTFGGAMVSPMMWLGGVVRGFHASRGLAIAVVLAGMGVATAIWPVIFAYYVQTLGWRLTFPAVALSWGVVVAPLAVLFYRPPQGTPEDERVARAKLPPVLPLLRTPVFLGLLVSAGLFAFVNLGLVFHFVPILKGHGMNLTSAAALAGLMGVFAVIGRLTTGALLDVFSTRVVTVAAFALVLPALALLILGDGSPATFLAVAVLIGLSAGAEMDAVTYIASRRFDPRSFGSVYSVLQSGIAVSASLGPLAAGHMFDISGSYASFIWLCVPLNVVAVIVIAVVTSLHHAAPVALEATGEEAADAT